MQRNLRDQHKFVSDLVHATTGQQQLLNFFYRFESCSQFYKTWTFSCCMNFILKLCKIKQINLAVEKTNVKVLCLFCISRSIINLNFFIFVWLMTTCVVRIYEISNLWKSNWFALFVPFESKFCMSSVKHNPPTSRASINWVRIVFLTALTENFRWWCYRQIYCVVYLCPFQPWMI